MNHNSSFSVDHSDPNKVFIDDGPQMGTASNPADARATYPPRFVTKDKALPGLIDAIAKKQQIAAARAIEDEELNRKFEEAKAAQEQRDAAIENLKEAVRREAALKGALLQCQARLPECLAESSEIAGYSESRHSDHAVEENELLHKIRIYPAEIEKQGKKVAALKKVIDDLEKAFGFKSAVESKPEPEPEQSEDLSLPSSLRKKK